MYIHKIDKIRCMYILTLKWLLYDKFKALSLKSILVTLIFIYVQIYITMVYTEKRPTHLVNSPLILGNRNIISHSI